MLNARYYENGKYTGSRKRETVAQFMSDHPQHEVEIIGCCEPKGLIAILRDTRATDSVIRVYDPQIHKSMRWELSEVS